MSGSASKSYGIHVAKLAGIPQKLLQRAGEKLKELEQSSSRDDLSSRENDDVQLSIFTDNFVYDSVSEKLNSINLMELTPSEAIKTIEELKGLVNDKNIR